MKDLDVLKQEANLDLRTARELREEQEARSNRDRPILAAFDKMASGIGMPHSPGAKHVADLASVPDRSNAKGIETLRNFALAHDEIPFAHLCTAALAQLGNPAGEQWAVDRLDEARQDIAERIECHGHPAGPHDEMGVTVYCDGTCRPLVECRLEVIRDIDTTRPDGAIAREIEV